MYGGYFRFQPQKSRLETYSSTNAYIQGPDHGSRSASERRGISFWPFWI